MKITGIICEYNPFHLGHQKQIDRIRAENEDCGIVCLMSGNVVQRGQPAIVDKSCRAKAAVLSGADLVLELPVTAALSSAEGFASEGVRLLDGFCDSLCFGSETGNKEALMATAQALLCPAFPEALAIALKKGVSFPAARQAALESMGIDSQVLSRPNDILAVEYCKAILSQNSRLTPEPIRRLGNYHDTAADSSDPSATAVRELLLNHSDWKRYVPQSAHSCFEGQALHTLAAGERAVLGKLRTMSDEEFEALPYGSEGLCRKLMHAARKEATLENILNTVKSKRYTRTRLDRMVMCAFLGLTTDDMCSPAPYARALAFNDKGREILKLARQSGSFPNMGEKVDHPYQAIEDRCGALYGLFSTESPEFPDAESAQRVYYHKP